MWNFGSSLSEAGALSVPSAAVILRTRAKRLKTKGIYFLFRFLETLLSPVVAGYFLYRGFRNPAYFTSLGERLGRLPRSYRQTAAGAIWLHAVSVGEVISLQGLVRQLREKFPHAPLFVSAGTLAGHAIAREKLAGIAS